MACDTKLSALTELAAPPATGDDIYIRDISENAAEQSKRITMANIWNMPDSTPFVLGTSADIKITHQTSARCPDEEITNIIEGASDHQGFAPNSLVISNITNDGDIIMLVSDGGNSKEFLLANADVAELTLGHGMATAILKTASGDVTLAPGANLIHTLTGTNASAVFGGSVVDGAALALNNTALRTIITSVGHQFHVPAQTSLFDNPVAGCCQPSVAIGAEVFLGIPTWDNIIACTELTITRAATIYIEGAPVGTPCNVTLTDTHALWVDSGTSRFEGTVIIPNTFGLRISSDTGKCIGGTEGALQVLGTGFTQSTQALARFHNVSGGVNFQYVKSRSATVAGCPVIVQDGDSIGNIIFHVDDGTDLASFPAEFQAKIDGAPGTNDTPGELIFRTAPDGSNVATDTLTLKASGNVLIGSLTQPTTGTDGLILPDGTALACMGSNTAGFYADDCGGTVNPVAIDEAGTAVILAPHGFKLFDPDPNERFPFDFQAKNKHLGIEMAVDMTKLVRLVEGLTGAKILYEQDLPPCEVTDWMDNQRKQGETRKHKYAIWEAHRDEHDPAEGEFHEQTPPLPMIKQPPTYLRNELIRQGRWNASDYAKERANVNAWRGARGLPPCNHQNRGQAP